VYFLKLAAMFAVVWFVLSQWRRYRYDREFLKLTEWLDMDRLLVSRCILSRAWLELFEHTGNKLRERSYLLLFKIERSAEELRQEGCITWEEAYALDFVVGQTRVLLDETQWFMVCIVPPRLPGRIHKRLSPISEELTELERRIIFFTVFIEKGGRFVAKS
jgi:hypothetical protein